MDRATMMVGSEKPPQAEEVLNEFDFYRCHECKRLMTNPELMLALGPSGSGQPCPCGSTHIRPTNLPWWGWALPRVWHFASCRLRHFSNEEAATRWAWWRRWFAHSVQTRPVGVVRNRAV